jgi:DNA-binding GntR family transcriptional regulator
MAEAGMHVLDQIRNAILDGRWAPGERLPPAAMAKQFGASSTVVREALTKLNGDGLVAFERNRGFFVRSLDLGELRDITELRCVSEALAARLAVERGDLQWESELIAAHHQLVRTPRRLPGEPERISSEWAAVHRSFHAKLLEPCASVHMLRLADNLADSTELYRRWAATSDAAVHRDVEREHAEILEAALSREAEHLGALLRAHYETTVHVVLEAGLMQAESTTR